MQTNGTHSKRSFTMRAHTYPKLLVIHTACLLIVSAAQAAPISVMDIVKVKASNEKCVDLVRRYDSVDALDKEGKEIYSLFKQSQTKESPTEPSAYPKRNKDFIVKATDKFTISLQQGLVNDFQEFRLSNLAGRKKGDIAIVVNVQERRPGVDYNFKPGSEQEGRVVFFQKNVEAGAPLNLANLPVYGPATYDGYPLMISLYVIEIDAGDNKEISGIVDSLANLSKTVSPVNTAAISVLNTLGGTLLKLNKNDLIAEYRAELAPGAGEHPAIRNLVLEYGNYAFTTMKNAKVWHEWDRLYYNQSNARLYIKDENNNSNHCGAPYKEESWLTFQVNKSETTSDLPTTNTLSALISQLEIDSTSTAKLQEITDTIVANKKNGIAFEKYKTLLSHIQEKEESFDFRSDPDIKKYLTSMITSVFGDGSKFTTLQKERIIDDLRVISKVPYLSKADSADEIIEALKLK